MKILLTGYTGFIGKFVAKELQKHKRLELITTSRSPSSNEKIFDLNNIDDNINYYDYFEKPDLVIHVAWGNVRDINNIEHLEKNLFNHMRFIKNLVANGAKNIVVIGSGFEYGKQYGKMKNHITNPNCAYAIAKNTLRQYIQTLKNNYSFTFKWLRVFYVYDQNGQHGSNIISQLRQSIEQGDKVFYMSKGEQLLDYIDVEELASLIVKISLQNKIVGEIDCCKGEPIGLTTLIEDCLKRWEKSIKLDKGFYQYREFESISIWGDNTKMMMAIEEFDKLKGKYI